MRSSADENYSRWQVVKGVLKSELLSLPSNVKVSVRAFGHNKSEYNKIESCKDSELLWPFDKLQNVKWQEKIDNLQSKGLTSLAYAISQAGKDLEQIDSDNKVLILLSDGAESCSGNPSAEMQKLKERGLKIVFKAIGLQTDSHANQQLRALAKIYSGEFRHSDNAVDFVEMLDSATFMSLNSMERNSWQGVKTIGDAGVSFDSGRNSANIVSDQEIEGTIGNIDSFDHFSFKAETGEKYLLTLKTQIPTKLSIKVISSSKEELLSFTQNNVISEASEVFTIKNTETHFIEIKLLKDSIVRFPYYINLKKQVDF
jgi:hypothetical protein